MRRGLITARGSSKHDKLMASVIKFLITRCDASPLDIHTEKKFKITKGNTYVDIVWKGKLIECVASSKGMCGKKLNNLLDLNKPIFIAIPKKMDIESISGRLIPLIKGIFLFNLEKEELFKSFRSFDEYLGYTLLEKPTKTVTVDF